MLFGSLLPKRPRKVREKAVRDMAAALNAHDYGRVGQLVTDDLVVAHVRGGRTEEREAFIENDRAFREGPARPRIVIEELIHHLDGVLVRGRLESRDPEISGPSLWKIDFADEKISRIEITRAETRAFQTGRSAEPVPEDRAATS